MSKFATLVRIYYSGNEIDEAKMYYLNVDIKKSLYSPPERVLALKISEYIRLLFMT